VEKIRSVSALPDWFRSRTYRKKLTDVEWFREIRRREYIAKLLRMSEESSADTKNRFLSILTSDIAKTPSNSLIYEVSQQCEAIRDLDAGEAIFLRFAVHQRDEHKIAQEYEQLLASWCGVLQEAAAASDVTPKFGKYESDLATFAKHLDGDEHARWLYSPSYDADDERLGNPWLSYGRPLNGFPVTIDTQFDDETIITHVKLWLAEKRKSEGQKARRPYNQNDFDSWEYYKIRELFDLETWAAALNVKILDNVIASALWPHAPDEFSPIDVLRTTARKKAKDVFRFETSVRLRRQLLLSHGENFLDQ
jgi:hypothetical protein